MMKYRMTTGVLFTLLLIGDAYAKNSNSDSTLARMFSPILILTKDEKEPSRRVIKPEPVEIVGANSASNLHFYTFNLGGKVRDIESFDRWDPPLQRLGVNFSENKFASLTRKFVYSGIPLGFKKLDRGLFTVQSHFDYPGNDPTSWNKTYFGDGPHAGENENFPNTAYVHIYETTHEAYSDPITVIQYFYFYPYNHWWNRHEGDWPRVNVVVSSSDPNDPTLEVLGVEYSFHGAHLSYYNNYGSNPSITSNFVFNPRREIRLNQGTHPIIYVSAGGHGSYPTGGTYTLYELEANEGVWEALVPWSGPLLILEIIDGSRIVKFLERMTHTGLILTTEVKNSYPTLQEGYDLVLLPEPKPNQDNKGLPANLSWLGADVRWGNIEVDSFPGSDNRGAIGPYNNGSWENLKFFSESSMGPNYAKGLLESHPIRHGNIPYTNYHHWPIIGDEVWSGAISLSGDIVIFLGATLTIESGTIIEFEPRTDIHKFPAQGRGVDNQAELFVYGTLNAEGTATSPIRFRRKSGTPAQAGYAWGGIRIMEGGSVDLDHTTIRDTPPPPPPTGLTAQAGTGQATLRWDAYPVDASITAWQYRLKPEGVGWRDWQTIPHSGPLTAEHTVTGLIDGEATTFLVRAVNPTGAGSAAAVSVDIPLSSSLVKPTHTPTLTARAGDGEVTLRWDEPNAIQCTWQYQQTSGFVAQSAAWKPIPASKTFTTEYTVGSLTNGQTYVFTVRAVNDYGQGPASASVSVTPTTGGPKVPPPPTAMLSIAVPVTPPGQSVRRPGQLDVRWGAVSATPAVNGYALRYQSRPDLGVAISPWSDWCILPDALAAGTTRYTHTGLRGNTLYRYQVRATNAQGPGAWSAVFPADGLKPNAPPKPPARWPSAPQHLVAEGGAESVVLTWQAPASHGGAAITGYRYRYRAAGRTRWSPSAEGMPLGQTTSHTVSTLSNGTEYTFAVWAVNSVGNGASATATAMPPGVPDAPVLRTRPLDGKVALTTRLGAENGAPITRIETRVYSVQPSRKDTTWVVKKGSWKRDLVDPSAFYYRSLFTGGQTTTWSRLTNGVAYTFEVRSVNEVGPSAIASVAATPGQAASSVVARLPLTASVGDGQVRLGWTPTPGWVIEQYQVQSRVARAGHGWPGWSAVPGGGAVRDTTITGLLNGTEYEFRVRAVNNKGESLAISNVVLATPAGRPGVPVLTASGGDGQVALSWTAADANGSAMVRYEMQGRVAASGHGWPGWSAVPGGSTARDTTITGLTNDTEYEFRVRAVNGVGAGAAAAATATPQPTGVRLPLTAAGGDGQVTLGWTAPANRASVHEYQVRQRISAAGHGWSAWSAVSGGNTARDTTITGLTNGVSYQFEAQAVDRQGTSVAISNVKSATPAGPPGMPALTASGGDGQVALSWTAAAANGSAITRYEMQGRVASSGHGWPGWSAVPGGSTTRDTTITGLTNDTEYEFAVRAVNGVGAGASSSQKATPQATATTPAVSFGAAAYQATEGGEAVEVSVGLSPSPSQTVRIPVVVSADAGTEAGDYTVAGLRGGTVWLSFAADASSQSFAMTANEDADSDDETVSLSFGTLPAGVVAGTPRQATVTLRDDDADTAPSFASSGTSRSAIVGHYFSFTRPAASGGNGSRRYSVSGSCPGLTITASSASGQPSKAGQCGITWTVRDTDGDSDTYSLQLNVRHRRT